MKRPIVVILLIWGIGLFLWLKSIPFVVVTLILLFILYVTQFDKIQVKHVLICLGLCLCSLVRIMLYDLTYNNESVYLANHEGNTLKATVVSCTMRNEGYVYILNHWSDSSHYKSHFKLKVTSNSKASIGDVVEVTGAYLPIEAMRNEGGFDNKAYCKQKGYTGLIQGKLNVVESKRSYALLRYLKTLQLEHYTIISSLLPHEQSSIIGTLLLGLDTVDDELEESFRTVGLIHILAISGLHVSIIAIGFFSLLRKLLPIKIATFMTISLAFLYCLYTGGHTSTVRATLMVSLYLIQYLTIRRYDPTSSLAVVALVLLILNPYQIMNAGFMLSFSAVASLFYITPALKRDFIKGDGFLWDQLRTMIAVQIGLGPIMLFYFHTVSVYSIFANLLVLPVVSIIILFSIISIMLAYIFMPFAVFASGVVFWLLNYTLSVVGFMDDLPYNQFKMGHVSCLTMGLFCLLILLWLNYSNKYWLVFVMTTLIISLTYTSYKDYNNLVIRHMDVGQGDAAIVTYRDRCILIDGGGIIGKDLKENVGTYVLMPFLENAGIKKIDTVFISHSDFDHIYGIIEVAQQIPISRVVLSKYEESHPDRPMLDQLFEVIGDETEVVYMTERESITYGSLHFECLSPFRTMSYENPNDASLILMLDYGEFQGLFLGDASVEQELAVLSLLEDEAKDIELIKVAHHGSKSASDPSFYEGLRPDVSVVSVGRNTYGQPDDTVMTTLERFSTQVRTTIDYGEVIIKTDGEWMTIDTMLD